MNEVVAAHGSFMDLVDLYVTKPKMGDLFGTTAWFLWNHRKKVRLNDRTLLLSRVGEAAKNLVQQVQSVREGHRGVRRNRRCKWTPPQVGDFKANFDGAWFDESDEAGIGIVVRDSSGLVLAALAEKIKKPHSVDCLEMMAARRAVIFAQEIGLQSCQFEGDSEVVTEALKNEDMFCSSFGHIVRDTLVCVNSLSSFTFAHIC